MRKMKLVNRTGFQIGKLKINIVGWLIILIILVTMAMIKYVGNVLTPKVNDLILFRVDRFINSSVVSIMDNEAFTSNDFLNILKITKNKDDEIISVDFDAAYSSKLIRIATEKINDVINDVDNGSELENLFDYEYAKSGDGKIIAFVPLGMLSDSVFLGTLGPKIPAEITVMSDYYSTFESQIKNYGVNTILIEIYLNIYVTNVILLNFNEARESKVYTLLVASKVVNGRVPEYYGNMISTTSPLVTNGE